MGGTFVFKWPHAAEEVYVTGTFDDWSKSEKLEKVGDTFEKRVTLPKLSEKILYKFVVDGTWTTDHLAARENDEKGNENNVLHPSDIVDDEPTQLAAAISSVGPESTTADLAGAVPLEKHNIPGHFPETPATELEKEFNINPLPAADGAINPIKLESGEKIPETVAAQDINSHVTLDKESYEKSDRLPGVATEMPPVTTTMIPESSLPIIGPDVAISTVTANATTAALAGQVPLEEAKVPQVVKDSQEAANAEPEASAVSEAVQEKAAVEDELLSKVPEAPTTSEGTAGKGTDKSENDKTLAETLTAAAAVAGTAAVTIGLATRDTVTSAAADLATKLPESVQAAIPTGELAPALSKEKEIQEVSPEVPPAVRESIVEAGTDPEAAANTAAVEEKKAVEAELLKEVKPVEPISTAAASEVTPSTIQDTAKVADEVPSAVKDSIAEAGTSPEAAANSVAVEEKKNVEAELLEQVKPVQALDETPKVASEVPVTVKDSIAEAGASPEAAANSAAVQEKKTVETELLEQVKPVEAVTASASAAPTSTLEDVPKTTPAEALKDQPEPTTTTEPVSGSKTNGAGTASLKETKETGTASPSAATESSAKPTGSPAAATKKKNRLSSFFGKLKDKVGSHKDKA